MARAPVSRFLVSAGGLDQGIALGRQNEVIACHLTAQFPALPPAGASRIATVGGVSEFELEPVRVRVLPHEAPGTLAVRNEARTAAIAAVGGVLAGAATVAAVRAVGAAAKRSPGRLLPGRKRQQKVVASRSFLVDVHLLGR
jgi:hypothetical protein